MDNNIDLLTYDFSKIDIFTFSGLSINGVVTDVYDGDTLTFGFLYNNSPTKVKIRMEGYDSPEMKPLLSIDNRDLHIKCSHLAKDKLTSLIKNKIVNVKFDKTDKYGRQLAKLYIDNICINDIMIDKGYGKPYNGSKKSPFTKEDLLKIESLNCTDIFL